MKIALPSDAMVVLVGIAGSGKSTYAAAHFTPTQVLSSDSFRSMVSDDETDQSATEDAFRLLHAVLEARLRRGRLTVVDATNVEDWSRHQLLGIAARYRRPAVAIVFDTPLAVCLERLARRGIRPVPPRAVRRQHRELQRWIGNLEAEGFAAIYVLDSAAALARSAVRASGAHDLQGD